MPEGKGQGIQVTRIAGNLAAAVDGAKSARRP